MQPEDQEDSETELEEDELSPQNQMELDPEETIFQRAKRMESLKKKAQAVPSEDEETESEEESMHERAKRRMAEKAQRRLAESSKNGQVRDGSQSASQGSAIQRSSIQAVARPVSAHVRSVSALSARFLVLLYRGRLRYCLHLDGTTEAMNSLTLGM